MKPQIGIYHMGRCRNIWGVWQYTSVNENGSCSKKIENCCRAKDAYLRVYELNNWGTPKRIPNWIENEH